MVNRYRIRGIRSWRTERSFDTCQSFVIRPKFISGEFRKKVLGVEPNALPCSGLIIQYLFNPRNCTISSKVSFVTYVSSARFDLYKVVNGEV
jgi:hypothetical protein